ncbi:LysE family translocator [Streptomyces yaizuensis]|uniref:LysE family translocator n=1 Tax=Streptomyces yaizuensis TaxID=2989713 RepID=A0ABQ5P587_9ACTN|nr:LysE family translocator [Streptomyces sp. YSPA8]GLF97757.1 LysE family translocator [Streptomyces sp. YSPA8]
MTVPDVVSWVFIGSSLAVIVTPGPDNALVARLVLRAAPRRFVGSVILGIMLAGSAYAAVSVAGVAVLASQEPAWFTALRWCGAAVLLVWGLQALIGAARAPAPDAGAEEKGTGPSTSVLRGVGLGLLCTGSNPKVILFFVAFLPQFVPRDSSESSGQAALALLAVFYLTLVACWHILVSEVLLVVRRRLDGRRRATLALTRATDGLMGVVFVTLSVRLVWSG